MIQVAAHASSDNASWDWAQFGDLFKIQQGKALSQKARQGVNPHLFLRTANVLWGKLDLRVVDRMDFSTDEEAKYRLEPGDLLVLEGGEVGRAAMWSGELEACCYQNHIHRCRPSHGDADPSFYMYWMQYAFLIGNLYLGHANVTTIANLSKSRLAAFEVPHPPVPEQHDIAHVLRTVQRAREQTEQVIAAARELQRSLMRHLFTYGPVPVDETEQIALVETDAGSVPAHWRVRPLAEVAEIRTSTTPPSRIQETTNASSEKLLFLRVSDLGNPQNERAVVTAATEFRVASPIPAGIKYVRPGSVVLPKRGAAIATNRKRQVAYPSLLDPNLASITAGRELQADYLFRWVERLDLRVITDAATLPQLNKRDLAPLPISVPPTDEQMLIADTLSTVEGKIRAEEQRRAALDTLFDSLLHDLMTARLRLDHLASEFA